MKKFIALALVFALSLCLFAACSGNSDTSTTAPNGETVANTQKAAESYIVGVPNDTTNEARALLLLEEMGLIKLKEGAGITATKLDIVENPHNIEIKEVAAAQLPDLLDDTDFSVINSNFAISAGLNPMTDGLKLEGAFSAYANIVAVKEGNEETAKTKALVAALQSQRVADYITETYSGAVVSTVDNPGDGFDADVDYESIKGETIKVAASPEPHAAILKVAKEILAEKDVTLEIIEFTDYIQPNEAVESGDVDANYFQHAPYLNDFNAENGTHIVNAGAIHVEPMGIYGGKQTSLDVFA